MKALSIRQPWAWLIVNGHKTVENREWPTRFRGRFLIHAAKTMTRADYDACRIFLAGFSDLQIPALAALPRGGIVGEATVADCVIASESPWFCGPYGFVLSNPQPCPFHPCAGALMFWNAAGQTPAAHKETV